MQNPYKTQPDRAFWAKSLGTNGSPDVFSSSTARFPINPSDQLALAGSCFTQHLARGLASINQPIINLEPPGSNVLYSAEESQPFSARYGNIYSSRQLLQLFQRAYGFFEPRENVWRLGNGRYLDPFRPRISAEGLENQESILADMTAHLDAVQRMFRECSIFIFTVGLTEIWRSLNDGAVVPSPPAVLNTVQTAELYEPHNLTVREVQQDLEAFITLFRGVNPSARLIFTVSPVPLAATFTKNHVFCANTYSKSVLRLAIEEVVAEHDFVDYFPSYEYVTSPHRKESAFVENQRTVRQDVVQEVMSGFVERYMSNRATGSNVKTEHISPPIELFVSNVPDTEIKSEVNSFSEVPCDNELFGGAQDV